MTKWSFIYLEGFCMYSSCSKKKRNYYKLKDGKATKETIANPVFVKGYRPEWCIKKFKNSERTPEIRCLDPRCVFFAFCEADKNDKQAFELMHALKNQEVEFEDKKSYIKFMKKYEAMLK